MVIVNGVRVYCVRVNGVIGLMGSINEVMVNGRVRVDRAWVDGVDGVRAKNGVRLDGAHVNGVNINGVIVNWVRVNEVRVQLGKGKLIKVNGGHA